MAKTTLGVPAAPPTITDEKLSTIVAERGKAYGDWRLNHEFLGKVWTGLLEQHYGVRLARPIPGYLVALMQVGNKLLRASSDTVHHQDNYDDIANYLRFAEALSKEYFKAKEEPDD